MISLERINQVLKEEQAEIVILHSPAHKVTDDYTQPAFDYVAIRTPRGIAGGHIISYEHPNVITATDALSTLRSVVCTTFDYWPRMNEARRLRRILGKRLFAFALSL